MDTRIRQAVKNHFWHHERETSQAVQVYVTDTSIINTESFLRKVNCTIAPYSNLAVRTIRFLYIRKVDGLMLWKKPE
jgi:hypothetical protein